VSGARGGGGTTAPGAATAYDVRPGAGRDRTRTDWLDSRHSFSFGPHYDPANTHFGVLLAHNDDRLAPGAGFAEHPHRDLEIVTWVLAGALVHRDSEGNRGVVYPGLAQRMTAGTGIRHSETNDAGSAAGERPAGAPRPRPDEPVHYVQMWVRPDEAGLPPGYEQREVDETRLRSGLVVVASGRPRDAGDAAVRLHQRHASLLAARLDPGASVQLPDAPLVHLFVARGSVGLEGAGGLDTGDAVRITAADGQRVTAAADGAEVLLWAMDTNPT
jgi:redox-sensitive bicupin YhaK (pirin superfamily)